MTKDDKSFQDLLKDAPKAPNADTVTIVGTLAKSDDPKKFVLYVANGSAHTLDIVAVKKHTVLGHSVGHTIVQIELDREHLPAGAIGDDTRGLTIASHDNPNTGIADVQSHPITDLMHSFPTTDIHSTPWSDIVAKQPILDHGTPAYTDQLTTLVAGDQPGTIQENISDPGNIGDPAIRTAAPFSLALQHQIGGPQLDALSYYSPFAGPRTYFNANIWTSDHPHILNRAFF